MGYRIVLTDLIATPIGELKNFSDFQWFNGLSKMATCSFRLRLDHPYMDRLAGCNGIVKVYRGNQIIFNGPILTAQQIAERETRSIQINCVDYSWYLTKRLVGKSSTGALFATATNRADIVDTLLTAVNTEFWSGIAMASGRTSGSSVTYKIQYAPMMQALQELGNALDGFDWQYIPIENYNDGVLTTAGGPSQVVWGALFIRTLIGASKPAAVFEYGVGTRANILNWDITTTRDGQATKTYHMRDGNDVKTGSNPTAESYWGPLEDVVQGDFSDATMRQKLVDEHATVRGNPRTLVKITPHIDPGNTGRVPGLWVDYFPGDTITARIVDGGVVRFSGTLRVYASKVTLDQNGFERVELVLEDE